MSGYRITLTEEGSDGSIHPAFHLPTLPYPGLKIGHGAGVWEVIAVQLEVAQPGSMAERNGEPTTAQVIVRATTGVFTW